MLTHFAVLLPQLRVPLGAVGFLIVFMAAGIVSDAAAAENPWTGSWQITWPNGGGYVQLEQQGAIVKGTYSSGQDRIEARADGLQLAGQIMLGVDAEHFTAQLSPDEMSFSGHTDAGSWLNGLRIGGTLVTTGNSLAVDLQSPRAALSSFLEAGNRARAGDITAFALAADAIEPGAGQNGLSEEARIEGAKDLFDALDLATFSLTAIPNTVAEPLLRVSLPRLDSKLTVDLTFARSPDGNWRIVMPAAAALSAMTQASSPPTADGFRQLKSPRDTMRSFLDGMSHWGKGGEAEAVATLDLSDVPEVLRDAEGVVAANYLVRIVDRVGFMPLQSIPNSGATREPFVYYSHSAGNIVIEPYGVGNDTRWRFSSDTVQGLRRLYRAVEELPGGHLLDNGLIPYSQMFAVRDFVRAHAPALLSNVPGSYRVEYWQVIGGLAILTLTILLTFIISNIVLLILRRPEVRNHVSQPIRVAWAIGFGLAFLVGTQFIEHVGLTTAKWPYFASSIGTLILLALSYAAWGVVHAFSSLLQKYAERTDTPLDNIMLTFGTGVMRLALLGASGLLLGALWSLPTTGLLAGLGIGGLAIAFASKETLSNVFGAGILLTDRPFQTGDRIIAGDVNGWVEAVGLRSTRIRMLDDSVIVVPNGKLADMPIVNRGARRRQVLSKTLLVTSGGSPERLDALTEGIRNRLSSDPMFIAEDMEVNVAEVDRHGVEIEIYCGVDTLSGRSFRKAAHQFLLDVMSMARAQNLTLGRGTEMQLRSDAVED